MFNLGLVVFFSTHWIRTGTQDFPQDEVLHVGLTITICNKITEYALVVSERLHDTYFLIEQFVDLMFDRIK